MLRKVWFRTGEPSEVSLVGSPIGGSSMSEDSEPALHCG